MQGDRLGHGWQATGTGTGAGSTGSKEDAMVDHLLAVG